MRRESPESFYNAVAHQSHLVNAQHTVVVKNVPESIMFYLEEHIKAIQWIQEVLKVKKHTFNGRYNTLVNKEKIKETRDELHLWLPVWIAQHVPDNARAKEGTYPEETHVLYPTKDDLSSSAGTWMADSVNSFLTLDGSVMSGTKAPERTDEESTTKTTATMQQNEDANMGGVILENVNQLPGFKPGSRPTTYAEATIVSGLTEVEIASKTKKELIQMVVAQEQEYKQLTEKFEKMETTNNKKMTNLEDIMTAMALTLAKPTNEQKRNNRETKNSSTSITSKKRKPEDPLVEEDTAEIEVTAAEEPNDLMIIARDAMMELEAETGAVSPYKDNEQSMIADTAEKMDTEILFPRTFTAIDRL